MNMALPFVLLATLYLVLAKPNTDTVEYQLNELDSPILSVVFCGMDKNVLLGLSHKRTVYRSENSGFSWRPLQTILRREGLSQTDSDRSLGQVSSLKLSPVDPRLVVMLGTKGINWFTDDCGKSVWALNYGRPIYEFMFHPVMRDWGLAGSWTECSENEGCEIYKELYITKDFQEWTFVTSYVLQFSWAQANLEPFLQRRIPNDRILVTYLPGATGHQTIKGWTQKADLVRSDDYFKTTVTLVPRGNKFIISSRYVLVAQVTEEDSSEVRLLTAWERDLERFSTAQLPIEKLGDHSYTLLDTSEESVFLFVNHIGPGAQFGNLYLSDTTGRRFSTSLLHVSQGSDGLCDFDKVYGLEGIYLANVYDRDSLPRSPHSTVPASGKKAQKPTEDDGNKKTVISFDKGSIWKSLRAPERDSNGKRIACEEDDCSLHLHSVSVRMFSPFYSTESAIGLILGTGNIGSTLSSREDEINTYMSRDGGLTWSEVHKGSYIYEMGDHGALIVMAQNREATNTVLYSWNEGMTWEELKFAEESVEVSNIIISPGAISQSFLVLGSTKKGKGVTIALDFSSLHEPQCRSPELAGQDNSDYELWTPNDGRSGSKCLMGRTVTYTRRKRDAECFNGLEYERSQWKEPCECTEDDYECDLGYFREGNGPCRAIPGQESFYPGICLPGDEFYEIPTGYRRVAGNSCSGGVLEKYEPTIVYCSASVWHLSIPDVSVLVGFVCVIYGIYSGWEFLISTFRRIFRNFSETKYTRDFSQFPDTVDDDMIIRPPPQSPPAVAFNPRE